jgi:hypothetical protein
MLLLLDDLKTIGISINQEEQNTHPTEKQPRPQPEPPEQKKLCCE